jgi:hypothetical protein
VRVRLRLRAGRYTFALSGTDLPLVSWPVTVTAAARPARPARRRAAAPTAAIGPADVSCPAPTAPDGDPYLVVTAVRDAPVTGCAPGAAPAPPSTEPIVT